MPATKKEKLCVSVWQVDGTEWVYTQWHMKFCPKASANLLPLTCEVLQGNKISSDHWNNIVVKSSTGDIILDWVEFLQQTIEERAQSVTAFYKKNIIDIHIELVHQVIACATAKVMGI